MANNKKFQKSKNSEETRDSAAAATPAGDSEHKSSGKQKGSRARNTVGSVASVLMNGAANISFPVTMGYPIDLSEPIDGVTFNANARNQFQCPGVMRLGMVLTPGTAANWSDPFSTALRDEYSFIRHQNSGSSNYNAASLGMYFLQYASCLDYLTYMQRLAALIRCYAGQNGYLPERVVEAAGGDYTDLSANLAQFVAYINTYAVRLAALKVPKLPFFEMHTKLLANVFRDCDSPKSSFYVFTPEAFWVHEYGTTESDYGMKLEKAPLGKYSELKTFGDWLLNATLNDEMFNIMSGDIMKAHSEYMGVSLLDTNAVCQPIFDASVLIQIHNATPIWASTDYAYGAFKDWKITESLNDDANVGAITFAPRFNATNINGGNGRAIDCSLIYGASKKLIDLPFVNPTPGDIGSATRFTIGLTSKLGAENDRLVYDVTEFGPEIIVSVQILDTMFSAFYPVMFELDSVAAHSKFDYAPYLVQYTADYTIQEDGAWKGVHTPRIYGMLLDNYTALSKQVLREIHRARMLEALGMVK